MVLYLATLYWLNMELIYVSINIHCLLTTTRTDQVPSSTLTSQLSANIHCSHTQPQLHRCTARPKTMSSEHWVLGENDHDALTSTHNVLINTNI